MPTLYPTRSRITLLQHIKDEQVIATRESPTHPWVFVDLGVPTISGGKLVTANLQQMITLDEPWITVTETGQHDGKLELTRVGHLLLGAVNPAKVVGL